MIRIEQLFAKRDYSLGWTDGWTDEDRATKCPTVRPLTLWNQQYLDNGKFEDPPEERKRKQNKDAEKLL